MDELKPKEVTETYKPDKKEQEVLDFIYNRIYEMDRHRQNLNLETSWNKWLSQTSAGEASRDSELNIENPSKIKKSLTREAVFGILAMAAARNNQVQMIMQSEDDTKLAPVYQKLSEHLTYVAKEYGTKLKNLLTTIDLGIGVRKRIYRCDVRKVKEIVSYDPETETTEWKETKIKDYDDADLVNVDVFNFWWDDRATSHDDMRDCAERKIVPMSTFLDEYPVDKYKNAKLVKQGGWIWGTQDEKRTTPIHNQIGTDEVEVFEYHNKIKDMKHIIANGVLLTPVDSPIPYRHKQLPYTISVFQFREDAKRLDGVGIPELVEHDQAMLDTLHNMLIDWMKLMINKPILKMAGEDDIDDGNGKILLEAGKVYEVTDINNYKFFDIPDVNPSYFDGLKIVEENAKKKVGIDDPMYGIKTGGTATESAIAAQATKTKLDLFFKQLEEDVDVRDEWLKLNIIQQFYSQPERVDMIMGEDGEEIEQPVYRKLPIDLQETQNEFGETEFKEKKGAYFEVTPDSLGAANDRYAQFTVKIVSRSTLPISKELEKSKWNEHLQQLYSIPPLAMLLDPKKILKKDGEIFEYDAEDFMIEQAQDGLVQLAQEENDRMMNGEQIPPTQGATEEHTAVHMALADSTDFQGLDPAAQAVLVEHAKGEVAEQRLAGGQQTLMAAQDMNMQSQAQEQDFNKQLALKGAGKPADMGMATGNMAR